jgi:hypothetical protein
MADYKEYTIKSGQNFPDLAKIQYGDWHQYQRIVDANPQYAGNPTHTDTRWDPPVIAPTLYAGNKVKAPVDPKDDAGDTAETEQETPQTPPEITTTSESEGYYHHQVPFPRLELYSFDENGNASLYMTYDGEAQGAYRQLLRYQFSESVDDVRGSFSFTVENETENEETTLDKIKTHSAACFYEGDDRTPAFIGIIRRKSVNIAMGGQGPQKNITFSGTSILGIIADFILSLDIKIMGAPDAKAVSTQLTTDLVSATKIPQFLEITLAAYINLTVRTFSMNNVELVKIIESFYGAGMENIKNVFSCGEGDSDFSYSIANAIFAQGQNSIVDIWRNILPNPVYEIYGYCDRNGKPKIMVRETPFTAKKWNLLRATKVNPISLKGYSLQQSDEEVYTVFNAWLEGSAMGHDFYTIVSQYDGRDSALVIDDTKLKRYGYRPLEIAYRGYNRSANNEDESVNLSNRFNTLNTHTKEMYSRLDEMYNGTVTLTTNFNEPARNPRIGERLVFLEGEFYIKKSEHSWTYGGNPTNTLTVSRGMIYEDGEMRKGDAGVLQHIGDEMREIEA